MPTQKKKPTEVECNNCGLDDLCQILEYGEKDTGLPDETLKRRQKVEQGETVFRAGDPFRSIYAIKSGAFKSIIYSKSGEEQIIGFHFPGELIGTEGMARNSYSCTARALEASSICEINMQQLERAKIDEHQMYQGIIATLGKELAYTHAVCSPLSRQSSEQRLAAFILGVSERLGQRGMPNRQFRMSISRADIANYLGLASATVSRILTKLQEDDILTVRGKNYSLDNVEGLQQLAE